MTFNTIQKGILIAILAAIVSTFAFFIPWNITYRNAHFRSYSSIWKQVTITKRQYQALRTYDKLSYVQTHCNVRLDLPLLSSELLGIILVGTTLILIAFERKTQG